MLSDSRWMESREIIEYGKVRRRYDRMTPNREKGKWKGVYYVGRRTEYLRMRAKCLRWKMSFGKWPKGR